MQHIIAGGDTMLLSETRRLLTLSSQPRGATPQGVTQPRLLPASNTAVVLHAYSAIDAKGPAL